MTEHRQICRPEGAAPRWAAFSRGSVSYGDESKVCVIQAFSLFIRRAFLTKRGQEMTVCIGAVCDGGKAVVVAADRMMTYSAPMSLQVEMAVKKIVPITDSCAILFSGGVSEGEDVIRRTKGKTIGHGHTVSDIAQFAADSYQEVKNKRVEDTILKPWLGINFAAYPQVLAQSASSQMLQQIMGMIMQHNLQLELLVTGIDDSQGHLSAVMNPGLAAGFDTVGFSAIGSGGLHANVRLALGKQGTDRSLAETVYNVHEAKIAAEAAPGVGTLTDMAIISRGKIQFLDDAALSVLRSVHQTQPTIDAGTLSKLTDLCKEPSDVEQPT
jgi:20S proteasome alpha/beta subunit